MCGKMSLGADVHQQDCIIIIVIKGVMTAAELDVVLHPPSKIYQLSVRTEKKKIAWEIKKKLTERQSKVCFHDIIQMGGKNLKKLSVLRLITLVFILIFCIYLQCVSCFVCCLFKAFKVYLKLYF